MRNKIGKVSWEEISEGHESEKEVGIYAKRPLPWSSGYYEDRMGNDPEYSPGVTRTACFYLIDILEFLDKISFRGPHLR